MGSMAQQRPFKTEKPVTFAKVKPSVPAANGRSPRRPRKAVVMAIFTNHVKFIATSGRAMPLCNFSSEIMELMKSFETHFVILGLDPDSKVEEDTVTDIDSFCFSFLN